MDVDIKRVWLEALRSGDYTQGCDQLLNTESGGYCCLGVLCHATGNMTHGCSHDSNGEMSGHGIFLHPSLGAHFSLSQEDQRLLAAMNDQQGKTFTEIAAYIEEHL